MLNFGLPEEPVKITSAPPQFTIYHEYVKRPNASEMKSTTLCSIATLTCTEHFQDAMPHSVFHNTSNVFFMVLYFILFVPDFQCCAVSNQNWLTDRHP